VVVLSVLALLADLAADGRLGKRRSSNPYSTVQKIGCTKANPGSGAKGYLARISPEFFPTSSRAWQEQPVRLVDVQILPPGNDFHLFSSSGGIPL
jgi:hypothetical protein